MKRVKGAAASLRKVHQVVLDASCHNRHLSATGWLAIHRIQEGMRGEGRKGRDCMWTDTGRDQEMQTSGVENDQTTQRDRRGAASSILLLHQLEAARETTWYFCDVPNLPPNRKNLLHLTL